MINLIPGSWQVVLIVSILLLCIVGVWAIRPKRRGASRGHKYARRSHESFFNDARRHPGREPW